MSDVLNPNKMFEDYVYHSLLYYACDQNEIDDYAFDALCNRLLQIWPAVSHPDKGLADEASLRAGTGFQMMGSWPKWAKDRARAAGIEHWALDQPNGGFDDEKFPSDIFIPTSPALLQYYTGIGSRETPADALRTMRRFGKVQCDLGYRGRSGCAPGADTAFWTGAQMSERYGKVGFDNFLPNSWMFNKPEFGNIVPDPSRNIFDATRFVDTYELAQELACKARGSFEGLGRGGIALHSRNPYQVLGATLDVPSRGLVCYAQPIGRQGKVKGGTNTAVQIALDHEIEVINLYKDNDRSRIETFLSDMERDCPNAHIQ